MEERVCAVCTRQYEADIGKLMCRRLASEGLEKSLLFADNSCARARLLSAWETQGWLTAVSGLLLYDIAHLELALRVNALPVRLEEKRWILQKAVRLSRGVEERAIRGAVSSYFRENDELNLEGFARFRMPNVLLAWDACVNQAAEELLLETEYRKLIGILSAFVQLQKPKLERVYIILDPDGSCTLSDDMNMCIRYECGKGEGLLSLLVGLAPAHITVYDLSQGRADMFFDVLLRVFEDRVRYFK